MSSRGRMAEEVGKPQMSSPDIKGEEVPVSGKEAFGKNIELF
jgi:hypothetical protein